MKTQAKLIFKGMIPIWCVAGILVLMSLMANLPGLAGEIFSKILGIMFTPIFLECSLAFLGLIAVFCINNIRLKAEGNDYVEMEIKEDDPS